MGRSLLMRKNRGTSWNDTSIEIAMSFVDPHKVEFSKNPINAGTKKEGTFDNPRMGRLNLSYNYKLANIFFQQIGSEFGCREGLTRSMRDANRKIRDKNSVILIKEKVTHGNKNLTYRGIFKDGWNSFVREFLSHSNIDENFIEMFALTNTVGTIASFPITRYQKLTDYTLASALVGLIRNCTIFTGGTKGKFRSYEEIIIELINGLNQAWKVSGATDNPYSRNRSKYHLHSSNVVLWHILHYLDMMKSIPKSNPASTPNGPSTFVSSYLDGVVKAIHMADKEQIERMLDLLGGANSEIVVRFSSSIRAVILDKAKEIK